jgi:catechol 2,3-dioxygenase-like lactoylglutathione lyase family enzyme
VTRIHHVNVVVPPGGTDGVVGFYTKVLGLRQAPKPTEGVAQSGAWFDIDERTQVHVSERDGSSHPQSHFALVVDDFDDVLGRLREAGAAWEEQPDIFGGRRGFTRDPAGNRIEILEAAGSLA